MEQVLQSVERAVREAIALETGAAPPCDYRKIARAALEALREPSPTMVEAGVLVHDLEGDRIDLSPEVPEIWRAMIDAALGRAPARNDGGADLDGA